MCNLPEWLPELIKLEDFGGNWQRYKESLYEIFRRDFIDSQPKFNSLWVRCRRDPFYDGKEAGFWHLIQEGADEESRIPDARRCERLGWVRPIIEHPAELTVDYWKKKHGVRERHLLWFKEEFLVVLNLFTRKHDRFQYMVLITAYCTDREHTIRKLRKERDSYKTDEAAS